MKFGDIVSLCDAVNKLRGQRALFCLRFVRSLLWTNLDSCSFFMCHLHNIYRNHCCWFSTIARRLRTLDVSALSAQNHYNCQRGWAVMLDEQSASSNQTVTVTSNGNSSNFGVFAARRLRMTVSNCQLCSTVGGNKYTFFTRWIVIITEILLWKIKFACSHRNTNAFVSRDGYLVGCLWAPLAYTTRLWSTCSGNVWWLSCGSSVLTTMVG